MGSEYQYNESMPKPSGPRKSYTFTLGEGEKAIIEEAAAERNISVAAFIREAAMKAARSEEVREEIAGIVGSEVDVMAAYAKAIAFALATFDEQPDVKARTLQGLETAKKAHLETSKQHGELVPVADLTRMAQGGMNALNLLEPRRFGEELRRRVAYGETLTVEMMTEEIEGKIKRGAGGLDQLYRQLLPEMVHEALYGGTAASVPEDEEIEDIAGVLQDAEA